MRNEVDKANCQSQVSSNICGAGGHSAAMEAAVEKSHAVKDFIEQGLPTRLFLSKQLIPAKWPFLEHVGINLTKIMRVS